MSLRRWRNDRPEALKTVPNKITLEFEGNPTWHEFVVLRLLERAGWRGVWAKNWGGRAYWTDPGVVRALPDRTTQLIQELGREADVGSGGCWDVIAWREQCFLFVESKQRGKDALRTNQLAWLQAGMTHDRVDFAIAEYVALTSQG
ncbi:MAG: hypothetical protein ACREV8_00200 [Gammaproteobacteria bacterium]